tara:strand:+ start:742 stop:1086 length:345 start_codon:yes stop_codon:yes gene_type:complete
MGASVAKQAISATAKTVPRVIKGVKGTATKTIKGIKSGLKKGVDAVKGLKTKITGFGKKMRGGGFTEGDPIPLGKTVNTQARMGAKVGRPRGVGGADYKRATDIYTDMLMDPNL